MNPMQIRFVNEYVVDFNATQAAIRAGYSAKTAGSQGFDLLKHPEIREAVARRQQEVAAVAMLDAAWVVRQWMDLVTADVNEIVQVRRQCCRHCYGFDHGYQWTEAEYRKAVENAVNAGKPGPDASGGFGFDLNAPPAADCPECGGQGVESVAIADTRKLSPAAKMLYAGAEQTRNGIKVKLRDKEQALTNCARYLGMMVDRTELSGPEGGPILTVNPEDLTDAQLAAFLKGAAE